MENPKNQKVCTITVFTENALSCDDGGAYGI